jgi:hypothetical protein
MAEPAVKPPPAPARIEEGTVFIKNPSGVVHDMMEPHPGIEAAKKGDGGWHFASADEIKEYCERHNLKVPDLKGLNSEIKKALAEGEALKTEEAHAADIAAAATAVAATPTVNGEPVSEPAKRGPGRPPKGA